VDFNTLRQQSLAPALPTTLQYPAPPLGFHSSPKAKLPLPCALGWLISAFHRNPEFEESLNLPNPTALSNLKQQGDP
jgi:hypothetical protein